jgi:hypothetical protein
MMRLLYQQRHESRQLVTSTTYSFNTEILLKQLQEHLNYFAICDRSNYLHTSAQHAPMLVSLNKAAVRPSLLNVRPSGIICAGMGLYSTTEKIVAGQLVCLYGGTFYEAWEPIFFQSLCNRYIIRLSDGSFIDGKPSGLSRLLFLSCRSRAHLGISEACSRLWLENSLLSNHSPSPSIELGTLNNPLISTLIRSYGSGQWANHALSAQNANICYVELPLPPYTLPLYALPYLPNIPFGSHVVHSRLVGLVAICDIPAGSELFTQYYP